MTWLRSLGAGANAAKTVRVARRILEYGIFYASLFIVFNIEALSSLVHRWLHLDGWRQNAVTYALAMAFVLAVNEIWRRIDRRIFGPTESKTDAAVGVAG
jgi:hypothetical protein